MKKKMVSMLLVVSMLGLIFTGCSPTSTAETSKQEEKAEVVPVETQTEIQKAKNVILLIGDGMGYGQLETARVLEYGKDGKLNMQDMSNVASVTTYSYDNIVTDSAAAATAIASGIKTNNKSIGVDYEGNDVESITEVFQAQGKSIGIVATAGIYDATPAGFGSSVADRSDKSEIVRDYFDAQWDVLLGGGTKYFAPEKQDGVDMIEEFKASGYEYVTTADELSGVANADKLLGLFNYDEMTFTLDRDEKHEMTEEPTLKEMTMKALDVLEENENGFFLMAEGSEIDGAAHGGDAAGVWKETIEFDETVKYCLEWAKEHENTLVIVTADHNTASITTAEYLEVNYDAIKNTKKTTTYMALMLELNEEGTAFTPESIKNAIKTGTGLEITDEEVVEVQELLLLDYVGDWLRYNDYSIGKFLSKKFGYVVMDQFIYNEGNTYGHSGAWVPLFAEGPGSDVFEGVINNTDIKDLILSVTE